MGVSICGDAGTEHRGMHGLFLLRIHRARPSAATAVLGRWAIGFILAANHDFKRCQATQSLATVSGHVFVESVSGLDARIMGLASDFTQQSKFTLWEQSSSDVCHKSDTV